MCVQETKFRVVFFLSFLLLLFFCAVCLGMNSISSVIRLLFKLRKHCHRINYVSRLLFTWILFVEKTFDFEFHFTVNSNAPIVFHFIHFIEKSNAHTHTHKTITTETLNWNRIQNSPPLDSITVWWICVYISHVTRFQSARYALTTHRIHEYYTRT